ncbi:hypothetical protein BT566P1_00008 [Bacteroides phage BT566P1]|nr:hypothetical protein BT566P1_00008 [Bacteroides phage BT566P1]WAX09450.1 hypothetical protein BT566P2_00021 [Bacteroides phage BT566P2]
MIAHKKVNVIVDRALKVNAKVSEKIVGYGDGNLYPQIISELIYASKTASLSVERLSEAIECEGFKDRSFGEIKNAHGDNMDDILNMLAYDVARFRGCAVIVQYGGDYRPKMIYPVPFEYVRAGLNKDYLTNPVIHKYVVFNNWDRQNIKSTVLDKTAVTYPAFDPDNFANEVIEYGGIENHPGQLLYMNFFTTKPYPLSPFHAVQSEMQAEAMNSTYVERTLTRGFHMCSIVSHGDFTEQEEQDNFVKGLKEIMGAQGAGSALLVRDDNLMLPQSRPFIKVDQLGTPIDANLYKAYNEPLKKDIASQAYNIPIPLVDSSLISFSNASGEVVKEMQKVYRRSVTKLRSKLSREIARALDVPTELCEIYNELEGSGSVATLNTAGNE